MPANASRSIYTVLLAEAVQKLRDKKFEDAWHYLNRLAGMTEDHASEITAKRHHAAQKLRYLCEECIIHTTLDSVVAGLRQHIKTEALKRKMRDRRN